MLTENPSALKNFATAPSSARFVGGLACVSGSALLVVGRDARVCAPTRGSGCVAAHALVRERVFFVTSDLNGLT